jgi:N-hydroxyarylamine O-acetyltransferase
MLLRVELDGQTWLADVGFGGLTQTGPLLLQPDIEQHTPHETFRILETGGFYHLQVNTGTWWTLYRFDLSEQFAVDYSISNYFLSTNPTSLFRTKLISARALSAGRIALLDRRLTRHHGDGTKESRELASPEQLVKVLEEEFEIQLPEPERFFEVVQEKLFQAVQ